MKQTRKKDSVLAQKRKEKHYSQQQLSILSKVPLSVIRSYEQRQRNINKAECETIYRLAHALQCSMEELLEVAEM